MRPTDMMLSKAFSRFLLIALVTLSLTMAFTPGTILAQVNGKACDATATPCTLDSASAEYIHKASGVHFSTACLEEKNQLDSRTDLFSRTGRGFPIWTTSSDVGAATTRSPLARYFITVTGTEPARHFQSVLNGEKDALNALTLQNSANVCFERAIAGFAVAPPLIANWSSSQLTVADVHAKASCPAGSRPVWRMFNDSATAQPGKSVKAQHRFSASWAEVMQTLALNVSTAPTDYLSANWSDEGARFCAPGSDQWISLTIDPASLQPTASQAGSSVYALRFLLESNATDSNAARVPLLAVQLPVGVAYQSAGAGATCTADPSGAAGQRIVCTGGSLSPGGKGTVTLNVAATTSPNSGITVSAVALGSLSANATAEQADQLWPLACLSKGTPAYGCDKATGQLTADTAKQAAAKLSFEGSFSAVPTSQSPSPVTVALAGLTLRAGSTTTPVDVQFYVEYQAQGSASWQSVPQNYISWSSSAVVTGLVAPQSVPNIGGTINYPSTLPNPTVSLRICARVMDSSNAFDGAGACASLPINEGLTKVSESKSVNVGTIGSVVTPVLAIQNVGTQNVQPGNSLPAINFSVYRQNDSSPPNGDLTCQIATPVLGYSCSRSGTLLGNSTTASCSCTTSQAAPSSGTYYLTVSASASGASTSGQATGAIQVYAPPPPATDYSKLSWLTTPSMARDPITNVITVNAAVKNTGTVELRTWFGVRSDTSGVVGSVPGASVTNPATGIVSIAAGATQNVSIVAPNTVAAGTKLFVCAARINVFDTLPSADCSQSAIVTVDFAASATGTTPALSSPYWAVRTQEQTSAAAGPVTINTINLSSLPSGQVSSTFLVGCYEQQAGGASPPPCTISFTMADNSSRPLPANPLTLGSDYSLFFRGADANGNLTICAGKSWSDTTANGCNSPVWPDALAVNSMTVTIGTASNTVAIQRNVPPPPAVLTVVAPTQPSSVSSAGALPSLTFPVSRQIPSIPPTAAMTCAVAPPNSLGYSCAATGDIVAGASAACVCTPNPANAPTVTASQSYQVAVTASAAGAMNGSATATVTVQPVSANRGCTDDTSVPVIRDIDFANTVPFPKELYPFSTIGDGVSNPPSVAAIRLIVVAGGGLWLDGSMQVGPGRGTSTAEAVISRCRGRFDEGGRVQVIRLNGYTGNGNQSAITFFPAWWVDPVSTPDAYTATLNAPGRTAADGWVSDGIYYVNMRQTYCSAGVGGTCQREISGSGAVVPH